MWDLKCRDDNCICLCLPKQIWRDFFFHEGGGVYSWKYFFIYLFMWVFGQLARTTTNLTAHWTKLSGYVKHHGDDRRAHERSNPEQRKETSPFHHRAKTLNARENT
jgi:hypothetical protein